MFECAARAGMHGAFRGPLIATKPAGEISSEKVFAGVLWTPAKQAGRMIVRKQESPALSQ